jgi:hypothetical protein
MLDTDRLDELLTRLRLTAIRDQLDSLLDEASRTQMTLREALLFLAEREVARRDTRRISSCRLTTGGNKITINP